MGTGKNTQVLSLDKFLRNIANSSKLVADFSNATGKLKSRLDYFVNTHVDVDLAEEAKLESIKAEVKIKPLGSKSFFESKKTVMPAPLSAPVQNKKNRVK